MGAAATGSKPRAAGKENAGGATPIPAVKGARDWSADVDDMLAAFMGVPPTVVAQGAAVRAVRSSAARV